MSSLYKEKELLDTFGTTDVSITERAKYFLDAVNTWEYKLQCKSGFRISYKDKKHLGLFNVFQYGTEIVFKNELDMVYIKMKYSEYII